MTKTLKQQLEAKVSVYNQKLKKANLPTLDKLNVKADIRGFRTLGQFRTRENLIRLHPVAIDKYGEEYLNEVFAHEVCHYVVHAHPRWNINPFNRPKSHGREFKMVARVLGCEPRATTKLFDLSGEVKTRRSSRRSRPEVTTPTNGEKPVIYTANNAPHKYECNCRIYMIGTIRHRNMLKGKTFNCAKCKGRLVSADIKPVPKPLAPKRKVAPKAKPAPKTSGYEYEPVKYKCVCCGYTVILKKENNKVHCPNCKIESMHKV
jgi:predicted SprT family Zn-dependent metalloprotease/DNA-directed RNA polymerase subunit RPC12/RpoP